MHASRLSRFARRALLLVAAALALAPAGPARAQVCSLVAAASPASLAQGDVLNASWLGFNCPSFTGYFVDLEPVNVIGPSVQILSGNAATNDVHTTWTVPECQPPGTYRLRVTQGTVGGTYITISNNFDITAGGVPCVYSAKAGSGGGGAETPVVDQGAQLPITWQSQNQHHWCMYLYRNATGLPYDTSAFGGGPDGVVSCANPSSAQSANFTATANLSPLPSIPADRYKIRVAAFTSGGAFRDAFTNAFDVRATLAVGNVAASPTPVQTGSTLNVSWGQRNQTRYEVRVGGTVVASATSTATSASWAIPASFTPGLYSATVQIWNAANQTVSANSSSFTIRRATVAFGASASTVSEGGGGATIGVTMTTSDGQPLLAAATVAYAVTGGSATAGQDYTAISGTLTFGAGSASGSAQNLVLPILNDPFDEPNETVVLSLSSPGGSVLGANGSHTVTIADDDPTIGISILDASRLEGNAGSALLTFSVNLSASSGVAISVPWSTADGTAVAGQDYTAASGTVNFPIGVTSQTLSVSVLGDSRYEGNETFAVNLGPPTYGTISDGAAVGTIQDDDPIPSISVSDASAPEGTSTAGSASFSLTLSNPSAFTITVSFATADGNATAGTDYTPRSGTATFAANQVSQSLVVSFLADTTYEADETLSLNLSTPVNATIADGQGVGTLQNDDPLPALSIADATAVEGGTASPAVSLSNPSAFAISVSYATANGTATAGSDYAAASGLLSFAPGVVSQPIAVTTVADVVYERNETFTIGLSAPTNATISDGTGIVTIPNDDPAPTLSITDIAVAEGAGGSTAASFTAVLNGATALPAQVTYETADCTATAGSDYGALAPTTLTFPVGTASLPVSITVFGDVAFEGGDVFKLLLSNPVDMTLATPASQATILNDDPPPSPIPPRADFDADGRTDIVFRNTTSGSLVAWYMDGLRKLGGALFSPAQPVDANWLLVGQADFNADAKPDLLFWNQTSGNLVFWFMDGVTRVGSQLIAGELTLDLRVAGTGDFNHDGQTDILWRSESSGALSIWRMTGTTHDDTVSTAPAAPASTAWKLVAVGDLDSDGEPDLLFRNDVSAKLVAWLMNGETRDVGLFLTPDSASDPAWKPIAIADVDADGKGDILFQHDTTAEIRVWLMSGTTRLCEASLDPRAPAATNWRLVGPR